MPKRFLTRAHLAAATGAIAMIIAFLLVSAISEITGNSGEIRAARQGIVLALPLLITCLATAGITGLRLAGRSRSAAVRAKKRRLAAAAVIGLTVLIPCAVLLDYLAAARTGGPLVTGLEAGEWAFGSANLWLLALNFRAGLRMRKQRNSPSRPPQLAGSRP